MNPFSFLYRWFLCQWPEPDGGRPVRPAAPPPDHEEDDAAGSVSAAGLAERAAPGAPGRRAQHRLLRLRGRRSLLLPGHQPQLQTVLSAGCWGDAFICYHSNHQGPFLIKFPPPPHLKISSCLHSFDLT